MNKGIPIFPRFYLLKGLYRLEALGMKELWCLGVQGLGAGSRRQGPESGSQSAGAHLGLGQYPVVVV